MKSATRGGQVLVLVLLIVVVALAVGLSVAARNVTNLRTSTQTEQSQRAFSAAEGGVEDVLSRLSAIANDINVGSSVQSGCDIQPGGGQATCNVDVGAIDATVKVVSSTTYKSPIDLGSVGQLDLTNFNPAGSGVNKPITIYWANVNDAESQLPGPATIAVTQYIPGGGTPQVRQLFEGVINRGSSYESGTFDSPNCLADPALGFTKCATVQILPGATLFRIRPYWSKATVQVSNLTVPQTYEISSTAQTTSGVTRKVQVSRTALPQLPAVFDYVLYSDSDISK